MEGGTANMEFQTLTGLPMYNLSPSISILYTSCSSHELLSFNK